MLRRRFRCTLCGQRIRGFETFNGRPDARCPKCASLERHRLIWWYLTERVRIGSEPTSVLHIAPEGALAERLAALPNVEYVSGDLEPGRAMEVMDITSIQRPDRSFDIALVVHVLEHVPDDRAAMSELFRVLRPGGVALLQHPVVETWASTYEDDSITSEAGRLRAFGQEDHVRVYGADMRQRLMDTGFELSVVPFTDYLDAEGLAVPDATHDGRQDLYVCRRPA